MRTVVITRPAEQAQPWVDALRLRAIPVVHVPLLRIYAAGDEQLIQQAWRDIEQWTWVMFVSPNAVHYFFQYAQETLWPRSLRAGSPGEGTTQALIHAGVPAELIDQPKNHQEKDTAFLWQNIKHRDWQSARVLLVRGTSAKPPRNWLMDQLQEAGAFVQPLVVYQRESGIFLDNAQDWINSVQAHQACWVISSAESLDALAGHDWSQATAVVIHPRIAQAVRQL
ncbi:MAG: uroporphyrinogen-III synthase, partial [Saezia sp.]